MLAHTNADICMYMYVCMYVCMYVYTYPPVKVVRFMFVCMHVCMYVCMFVCMHMCVHLCMFVCMRMCVHLCMFVCMHICVHLCMFVYTYIHTYMYTQVLFSGSIFDNIKYSIYNSQEAQIDHSSSQDRSDRGTMEPMSERVERAAKIAHAHDFVSKLPQGYMVRHACACMCACTCVYKYDVIHMRMTKCRNCT
jgi:hypothetical protein